MCLSWFVTHIEFSTCCDSNWELFVDFASDDHKRRIRLFPTHFQIKMVQDIHIHVTQRIFIGFTEICEARHIMVSLRVFYISLVWNELRCVFLQATSTIEITAYRAISRKWTKRASKWIHGQRKSVRPSRHLLRVQQKGISLFRIGPKLRLINLNLCFQYSIRK